MPASCKTAVPIRMSTKISIHVCTHMPIHLSVHLHMHVPIHMLMLMSLCINLAMLQAACDRLIGLPSPSTAKYGSQRSVKQCWRI